MVKQSFIFFVAVLAYFSGRAQVQRFQFMQPKMGSPLHLIFYSPDSASATQLAASAFALVDSLNLIFSDYDRHSELSRLNATAGTGTFVTVSPLLFELIKASYTAAQQSKGAFDITVGPLSWLWRQSRRQAVFPADSLVQQAKAKTGFKKLLFDTAGRRIQLFQKGMQLDLGGIAKGYVAQAVVRFLTANGIAAALADAGGDMACSNAPPGKKGWTVGINVPQQPSALLNKVIVLQNKATATSGDVYQFSEHAGKRYSHIIDPRTGYGVISRRNVTVVARDGALADWLATACSILPIRAAKKLSKQHGAALLIGTLKNDRIRFYKNAAMRRYLRSAN